MINVLAKEHQPTSQLQGSIQAKTSSLIFQSRLLSFLFEFYFFSLSLSLLRKLFNKKKTNEMNFQKIIYWRLAKNILLLQSSEEHSDIFLKLRSLWFRWKVWLSGRWKCHISFEQLYSVPQRRQSNLTLYSVSYIFLKPKRGGN